MFFSFVMFLNCDIRLLVLLLDVEPELRHTFLCRLASFQSMSSPLGTPSLPHQRIAPLPVRPKAAVVNLEDHRTLCVLMDYLLGLQLERVKVHQIVDIATTIRMLLQVPVTCRLQQQIRREQSLSSVKQVATRNLLSNTRRSHFDSSTTLHPARRLNQKRCILSPSKIPQPG